MADYPVDELDGRTPLEAADIPAINSLAAKGEVGMVQTVPEGMSPGSDVANLSLMGYEPEIYHTGRSPLEAASMGVELADTDIAFRCNLVTLEGDDPFESKTMKDHSSGEITNEESHELIEVIDRELGGNGLRFYPGVSYRHLLVWENGPYDFDLTPPHDILGQGIAEYLPAGPHGPFFLDLTKRSVELLENHPVNRKRKERGLNPANSIWIWGEGKRPQLALFADKYGLRGAVISAVDLINGIGVLAGLRPIHVEGATGNIHTNFDGKAAAAIEALSGDDDYVYLHLEAPDECGHQGDLREKIRSIELIDKKIVAPINAALAQFGEDYRILILPDHPTPIALRTHVSEPVPYVLFDSRKAAVEGGQEKDQQFTEVSGRSTGRFFPTGPDLIRYYLSS
jgi:2,3-bisphosphoglycerate-independent phosphoglycerate mutase